MDRLFQYFISCCLLLFYCNLSAQEQTQGLPVTIEVKTPKNIMEGSVVLAGITSSIDDKPAQIQIEIVKPDGNMDKLSARADKTTGEYSIKYIPKAVGLYTVTAISQDKLQKATTEFEVEMDWKSEEEISDAIQDVNSTVAAMESSAEKLIQSGDLSPEHVAKTKEKVKKVKDNFKKYTDALLQIKDAVASIGQLVKKYPDFGPYIKMPVHTGQLASVLEEQKKDLSTVKAALNGPSLKNNDICGMLNAVSESCALFSSVMNIKSTSIVAILKNIGIDKAWPKCYDEKLAPKKLFNDADNYLVKQAGKQLLTATGGLEDLKKYDNINGIVGDFTQFVSDFLIKYYCTKYSGDLTGEYALEFKNNGIRYMYYKYKYAGKIALLAEKEKAKKDGAMFNGYIEANINEVAFDDDVWAVEDKSKWTQMYYRRIKMIVIPANLSEKDPGFGAIARQAMPGAFYFPIRGKMVQGKMIIELLPPMMELSTTNANRTVMVVTDPNNAFATQGIVFTYPTTTANFILTRTMRMPENNPKTSLDIKKEGTKNVIEGNFTRTETPADTKVDFKLNFKMQQEK